MRGPETTRAPSAATLEPSRNTTDTANGSTASIPERIPKALQSLRGWLVWRYVTDPKRPEKPRKVPHYAKSGSVRSGQQGAPTDRAQLVTLAEAVEAAERNKFDGVGLAMLPDWGLVALDFDDCVKSERIDSDVEDLLDGTYAEFSPSGNGVRAFMRGKLDNKKSRASGEQFGFETFHSTGFVTVTGKVLDLCEWLGTGETIADLTPAVLDLYERRFGLSSTTPTAPSSPQQRYDFNRLRDLLAVMPADHAANYDDWLHVGMALHHETAGSDGGLDLWNDWSAQADNYQSREDLERRWQGFGRGGDKVVTGATIERMAGTAAAMLDFEDVSGDGPTDTRPKFEVIPAAQFAAGKPPAWIVKGVLPLAELVVIYGESGSGKSFLALDLIAAVARGVEWRKCKVQQGRVVYIAAEGAGGFRKRLAAYAQHHAVDLASLPVGIIPTAPNLLTDDDKALAEAIIEAGGATIIVVDTLAQATPGANENAGEDMGKVLARCKRLHAATGALVVLIHHSGKDATRGARGWSGIRAAVDAEIEVARLADARTARVTKQKDGDDGAAFAFRLVQVAVGQDDEGEPITSCVIEHQDTAPRVVREPKGTWEKVVLRAAQELAEIGDAPLAVEALISNVVKTMPHDAGGGRDRRREFAKRAIESLCKGAFFSVFDNCIVMPHAASMPHEAHEATRQSPDSMPHMPHHPLGGAACGTGMRQ